MECHLHIVAGSDFKDTLMYDCSRGSTTVNWSFRDRLTRSRRKECYAAAAYFLSSQPRLEQFLSQLNLTSLHPVFQAKTLDLKCNAFFAWKKKLISPLRGAAVAATIQPRSLTEGWPWTKLHKVQIFWERHKILKKKLPSLTKLQSNVKYDGTFFLQIFPPSKNIWTLAVLTHHQSFLNVIDILQLFLSSHMYVKSQGSITLLKRNLKYKCRWWLDHESFVFYSYVLWPLKRKPKQDRIRKCRKIKYIYVHLYYIYFLK